MSIDPSDTKGAKKQSSAVLTDLCIGFRLKLRRKMLGLLRTDLANMVKLPAEELERMESGDERIPSSLLFEFCKLLEVPIAWFFEGANSWWTGISNDVDSAQNAVAVVGEQQDIALLLFYLDHITEPQSRRMLLNFAQVLAESNLSVSNSNGG